MKRRHIIAAAFAAAALGTTGSHAASPADRYPDRPLRIIVPFSAGGPADLVARVVGEKMQRDMGQPVVVLNKDGAGTILGVEMGARSSPDGYTLLMGSLAMMINAASGKKLPYDTFKDLIPITPVFTQPLILVVHPSVPAQNLKELVAYAKANPGKLKYGTSGIGTSIHLTTELFAIATGTVLTHVPYKGVAPAMTELLAGQTDLMTPGITAAVPHIRTGKLRVIGVTSAKRSQALPEAPTLIELGVPNFESVGWYGVLMPAGTPPAINSKLYNELLKVLALPDVKERFASQGGEAITSTPEQFAAMMRGDLKKWTTVIKSANINIE